MTYGLASLVIGAVLIVLFAWSAKRSDRRRGRLDAENFSKGKSIENAARVKNARQRLRDPVVAGRLRKKYTRPK